MLAVAGDSVSLQLVVRPTCVSCVNVHVAHKAGNVDCLRDCRIFKEMCSMVLLLLLPLLLLLLQPPPSLL